MSAPTSFLTTVWPGVARHSNLLVGGAIVAGGLSLLAGMRLGWIDILPHKSDVAGGGEVQAASPPTTVHLTEAKLAAAGLHAAAAKIAPIQATRSVPAAIDYDAARRVPLRAPAEGLVVKVFVQPGQQVAEGQPLAELSSPEVGLARDEVLNRQAELALAHRQLAHSEEIARNVEELLARLAQRPKPEDVEQALQKRTLGEYRERVVAAYSKLLLAEATATATESLEGGPLSKRLSQERRGAREVASAQFLAACETARFAAAQDLSKAKAASERTDRLLAVAEQALANLTGPLADAAPVSGRERLSELVLLSPIAGRIEERSAVAATRVAAGGPLIVVADTSVLWVTAEIHERDWAALDAAPGGEVRIRIPALQNAERAAKVRFVGGQVAAETRSVPLVAELANSDGRLRPGMFVWALVPLEEARQALVIPAAAVVRHENEPFVFVPAGERTFQRVDITLGLESGDQVEVTSGLKEGQEVVDQGALFLKSELLLEREE
jgi:RND family efflux transporter MFP subunit